MVSYYNPAAMYRHQQTVPTPSAQYHHTAGSGMHPHSWYAAAGGYHHQSAQGAPPTASYCMQEEQQMWHHGPPHPHPMFHQDFATDLVSHSGVALPHHHHHQQQQIGDLQAESQLPSPPITVSGSELSSPGGGSGNATPPNAGQTRPAPVRSPYEWIKKNSYQSQPNPGKTRTKDKYRVVYTDYQRIELEKEFTLNNKYITIRRKTELASNLGLSERQIKIWFQNRRAKERKQLKKRLEETHKDDPVGALQLQQYEQKMQQMQLQNQHCTQMQLSHQHQQQQQQHHHISNNHHHHQQHPNNLLLSPSSRITPSLVVGADYSPLNNNNASAIKFEEENLMKFEHNN